MATPWSAIHPVDEVRARELLADAFPELALRTVEPLGQGWDNNAYLVDGEWAVRFPRRDLAAPLIEHEAAVLPQLVGRLPLPVPAPGLVGAARLGYPWTFVGYRLLPGTPADTCEVSDDQRRAWAPGLADFVAALHGIDPDGVRDLPEDEMRRLDVPYRIERAQQALALAVETGVFERRGPIDALLERSPLGFRATRAVVAHGDLGQRHLLLDDAHEPCGVIDWGDLHRGDPAVDLALAFEVLPPDARAAFRARYEAARGPVPDDTWAVARLRALHQVLLLASQAGDTDDAALAASCRASLARVLADEPG